MAGVVTSHGRCDVEYDARYRATSPAGDSERDPDESLAMITKQSGGVDGTEATMNVVGARSCGSGENSRGE